LPARLVLGIKYGVAAIPKLLGYYGLDGGEYPVGFRLGVPPSPLSPALGVVGAADSLGGGVTQQALHGGI
jgi:hypothetical protein